MKKLLVSFATALVVSIVIPAHANEVMSVAPTSVAFKESGSAEVTKTESSEIKKTESAEVMAHIHRINEINGMDKSSLSSTEKKALRKELRASKKYVNNHGHGGVVYISGGVVLLIIVLIILF